MFADGVDGELALALELGNENRSLAADGSEIERPLLDGGALFKGILRGREASDGLIVGEQFFIRRDSRLESFSKGGPLLLIALVPAFLQIFWKAFELN